MPVQYFDASLSFAHWFYVELAFRFPETTVDMRGLRRYAAGQSLDVHSTGGDVVVAVAVERDDVDPEDDGQGWLSSLMAIRADIAGGDARALYFAWLLDVQSGEIDDDVVEPATPAAREIDRWIARFDADERVAVLSRVARGDGAVGAELMRRFRQRVPAHAATLPLRTAGALRARAQALAEQRREVILAREAKERMRREREQAAARDRHLSMLAKRQADAWRRVEALVITKRPGNDDAATCRGHRARPRAARSARKEVALSRASEEGRGLTRSRVRLGLPQTKNTRQGFDVLVKNWLGIRDDFRNYLITAA